MRLLRVIAILLMIVIFPGLCWLYLNSGKNWRVAALEEIAMTEAVPREGAIELTNGQKVDHTYVEGKFVVMLNAARTMDIDVIRKLQEQFGDNPLFSLLAFTDGKTDYDAYLDGWLRCSTVDCSPMQELLFEGDAQVALLDDAWQLRRRYDLQQPADLDRLIEHIAILMPIEKRPRIELDRSR